MSSTHSLSGSEQLAAAMWAAPASPAPAPNLLDVLRVLDMDTLASLVLGLSLKDLANARLACRALREACSNGVRQFTVTVSATARRPSPLVLFPWCSHLTLNVGVEIHSVQAPSDGEESEDMEKPDEGLGDAGYSHQQLAQLALGGVGAQARSRVTRLTIHNHGYVGRCAGFDLAGALCSLAPLLPALELLDASEVHYVGGMRAADYARPSRMYTALAEHCPRLRELKLPAAPGMLRGMGALAACGSLRALEVWELYPGIDGSAVLEREEVEELSRLCQLQTIKLRCHDRSDGGANLAALLGGRRPPQLANLELKASVRGIAAATGSNRLQLPFMRLECQPDRGRILEAALYWADPSILAFDRAAQVLVAATEQLPHGAGSRCISSLSIASFPFWKEAGAEADFVRCLGPEGWLARLAARCERVQLWDLDVSAQGVSAKAACAVMGVLGLPARLTLRHGTWGLRRGPACHQLMAARVKPAALLRPLPWTAAGGEQWVQQQPVQSVRPLQLESATAEDVLREVVERLWLAAAVYKEPLAPAAIRGKLPPTADDASTLKALEEDPDFTDDTMVLVRGALPPPGGPHLGREALGHWLNGLFVLPAPTVTAAVAGDGAASGAAVRAAEAAAPDAASGDGACAAGGLGQHLGSCDGVSVACAGAVLLPCKTRQDAAALVAVVAAAGAAAAVPAAVPAAVAGATGSCPPKAAVLPRAMTKAMARHIFSSSADVMQLSVLQVLLELWNGRQPQGAAGSGESGDSMGAPSADGGDDTGARQGLLSGADLGRLHRLMELDVELAQMFRHE